jgi:hypothetical protein
MIQQIVSWTDTEEGKKLLKGAKVEAFVAVEDKKYDVVRTMSRKYR